MVRLRGPSENGNKAVQHIFFRVLHARDNTTGHAPDPDTMASIPFATTFLLGHDRNMQTGRNKRALVLQSRILCACVFLRAAPVRFMHQTP